MTPILLEDCNGSWAAVPGYEDSLWVSSNGHVWQQVRHGKWIPPRYCSVNGFGYCILKHKKKQHKVHRLIATAFLGPPPETSCTVDHINQCRTDNRSCNLRWATKSEQCFNRKKPSTRRDARGLWVWELGKDKSSGKLYSSSEEVARELGVCASNIRKVAQKTYSQTGGWCAEYRDDADSGEELLYAEDFRLVHGVLVSQYGRIWNTNTDSAYTPRPGESQLYATAKNHLVHRLVALAFPEVVGYQPSRVR
eukprot:5906609-Prymnesium_polylepis.1